MSAGTLLDLVQNVSLIVLVAAGYAAVTRRRNWPDSARRTAIGILFGLGSLVAMADRLQVLPGVYIDGRNIMTSLVPIFGGPVAALATLLITLAYRLWLGGAGLLSGCAAAVIATLIGLGFRDLQRRAGLRLNAGTLLGLGAVVVLAGTVVFVVFSPVGSRSAVTAVLVPLLLVAPAGTMLLGLALQSEQERAALQSKLGEQTMLLQAIFRSIGKGIMVTDERGRIVLTNPAARALSAMAARAESGPADLHESKVFRLDGVSEVPFDELPVARAIRGEPTDNVELMITDPDGELRPVNYTGRPLVDEHGTRRGAVVVFRDIGKELNLQASLRRSERRLKDAIDAMENGFALFDVDDRLIVCNAGFIDEGTRQTFGNPVGRSGEEIFRAFAEAELTAVDALPDRQAWLRRRMELHRKPPREPLEVQWTDGRWMRVIERRTIEGGYVGIWTDVTELKAAETQLREAIESVPEGFLLLDAEMRVKLFNRRFLELYPATAPAVTIGQPFAEVLRYGAQNHEYPGIGSAADVETFVKSWMARFQRDEAYFGEGAFNDGRWVLVSHRRTASGNYVSLRTDITAQKQRERELDDLLQELTESQAATERAHSRSKRATEALHAITDAVPALISHIDAGGRYTYCNKEYQDVYGIAPEALAGRHITEVVGQSLYDLVRPQVEAALGGAEVTFVRPLSAEGAVRHVEQRYIPDRDAEGKVVGFYAIAWDITDRLQREETLNKEAFTDALTGLLNRRAMMQVLEESARRWSGGEIEAALLFLDLDKFKQINDTLGHDVGDELLKVFAERIRGVVRASDKVARLGGDEFVILLMAPAIEEIARRVATGLLERVRQPIHLAAHTLDVTTSIGVAVIAEGRSATPDALLKEADLALYEAKRAGRNTFSLRRIALQAGAA